MVWSPLVILFSCVLFWPDLEGRRFHCPITDPDPGIVHADIGPCTRTVQLLQAQSRLPSNLVTTSLPIIPPVISLIAGHFQAGTEASLCHCLPLI